MLISGEAAYRVRKGTAVAGTVRIPAYYRPSAENDYQPVTAIGALYDYTSEGAFSGCSSLTNISIPAGVTSIGRYAFYDCTSLTNITLPCPTIGDYAFSYCSNLTSVTFQGRSNSTDLRSYAFNGIGDLRDKYLAGGPGTYTRTRNGDTWTKQP